MSAMDAILAPQEACFLGLSRADFEERGAYGAYFASQTEIPGGY